MAKPDKQKTKERNQRRKQKQLANASIKRNRGR